jgi:hypothetical protein
MDRTVIPVTSSMCLGPGAHATPDGPRPWTPVPVASALDSIEKQRSYLVSNPPIEDLEGVWLPWSLRLTAQARGEDPVPVVGTEIQIRATCLAVLAELEALIRGREDEA